MRLLTSSTFLYRSVAYGVDSAFLFNAKHGECSGLVYWPTAARMCELPYLDCCDICRFHMWNVVLLCCE